MNFDINSFLAQQTNETIAAANVAPSLNVSDLPPAQAPGLFKITIVGAYAGESTNQEGQPTSYLSLNAIAYKTDINTLKQDDQAYGLKFYINIPNGSPTEAPYVKQLFLNFVVCANAYVNGALHLNIEERPSANGTFINKVVTNLEDVSLYGAFKIKAGKNGLRLLPVAFFDNKLRMPVEIVQNAPSGAIYKKFAYLENMAIPQQSAPYTAPAPMAQAPQQQGYTAPSPYQAPNMAPQGANLAYPGASVNSQAVNPYQAPNMAPQGAAVNNQAVNPYQAPNNANNPYQAQQPGANQSYQSQVKADAAYDRAMDAGMAAEDIPF